MPSIRSDVHSSMSEYGRGQKLWKFTYSDEVNTALQKMIYKKTAPEYALQVPENKYSFDVHIPKLPQIYRDMVFMKRCKKDPSIHKRGPSACSLTRDMSSAMEVLPILDRLLEPVTPKTQMLSKEKKSAEMQRSASSEGFRSYLSTKIETQRSQTGDNRKSLPIIAASKPEISLFKGKDELQTEDGATPPKKLPTIFELTATKIKLKTKVKKSIAKRAKASKQ